MTRYQYQVDYGEGYEDVYLTEQDAADSENFDKWIATVETEGRACRARVLGDGIVVKEREFKCKVVQSRVQPDGSLEHVVQCSGGQVTVTQHGDGHLMGSAQSGYVGDADHALERAYEAVRALDAHVY